MTDIRTKGFESPAQLREHLAELESPAEDPRAVYVPSADQQIVQRLRLGAPGAAAVPMIASQLDRRMW